MTPPSHPTSLTRVEAFSDAVIAIILTIMVLDLKLPEDAGLHTWPALVDTLAPKFGAYALSFVVIAKMWINHFNLLHVTSHVTPRLLWLNMLHLFVMSLIPFTTSFLSDEPDLPLAVACYAVVLCANALCLSMLRHYVARHLPTERTREVLRVRTMRLDLMAILLYGMSAPLAYVSVYLSYAMFIVVTVLINTVEHWPEKKDVAAETQES